MNYKKLTVDTFNELNGKVNKIIPARLKIITDSGISKNIYGSTYLNKVYIYLDNIINLKDIKLIRDQIKKTIIHELFHVEQIFHTYNKSILEKEVEYKVNEYLYNKSYNNTYIGVKSIKDFWFNKVLLDIIKYNIIEYYSDKITDINVLITEYDIHSNTINTNIKIKINNKFIIDELYKLDSLENKKIISRTFISCTNNIMNVYINIHSVYSENVIK